MRKSATSPESQLAFLGKIEHLLSSGGFTSTYKFALLLSLTNIAVEQGDDSDSALEVSMDDVARQYIGLYWNMARPYPLINALLKQNRESAKPARVISLLSDKAKHSSFNFQRLRVYHNDADRLVIQIRRLLAKDVLYRLQTIGTSRESRADRFLYDHPPTAAECARLKSITLKPGVAACFRRLRGVIMAMVQARWALWVRENNEQLSTDRQLESFLFGAQRTPVSLYAERLYHLQSGRCFYTDDPLSKNTKLEVDHFIPWARYACDSPFNLVLTSRAWNNEMRDQLKPQDKLHKLLIRNDREFQSLTQPEPHGFGAAPEDKQSVRMIAKWVYAAQSLAKSAAR